MNWQEMSYAERRERADFLARRIRNASRSLWRIAENLSEQGDADLEAPLSFIHKADNATGLRRILRRTGSLDTLTTD